MSTTNINSPEEPKFTRGEKCLYIHVVVTFVLILTVAFTFLVHLYLIDHTIENVFQMRRSYQYKPKLGQNIQIGAAYLNDPPDIVCNTLLFRQSWSIAPGHCVAMHSEPDMNYLFPSWRIRYKSSDADTEVKKSIVHPNFNRSTLANNIGLFQHTHEVKMHKLPILTPPTTDFDNMLMGSWDDNLDSFRNPKYYRIRFMSAEVCTNYLFPIISVRSYEYCVTFSEKQDCSIEHGALTTIDNKMSGIFSWGEKTENVLPFVILNLTYFQDWILENVF